MTPKDFLQLTRGGETDRLELKTQAPTNEAVARAVCAFLNHVGGRVVIGVGDDGELKGVPNAAAVAKRIESELPKMISPPALWAVEVMRVGEREAVIIEVPAGKDKPYVAVGGIFFRRGEHIVAATRDEISALIQNRVDAAQRWERQLVAGAAPSDLDEKLVLDTAKMAVDSERWSGETDSSDAFLSALGLVSNGGVTNGAMALFGKKPSRFLPQIRVRLVVMPEGKTGDRYSFDKTFDDSLLRMAQQIPDALESRIGGVQSNFTDAEWARRESVLFPPKAVREGVLNALAHRDYALSGSILISIFRDSMEITNPGGLPDHLTPADLKKDHLSMPRNPDIAHVFFLRRLTEKVGRGTQRIVEDCRNARLKEPRWYTSSLQTRLTFFAPPSGSTMRGKFELNERQEKMLKFARDHARLKPSDLVKLFGSVVSDRTLRTDLQQLVQAGELMRRGRGRGISYVLDSKGA